MSKSPNPQLIRLLAAWVILSCVLVIVGIVNVLSPRSVAPTCDGQIMSYYDTCQVTSYTNGVQTGTSDYTYDEKLSQEQSSHDSWVAWLPISIISLVLSLVSSRLYVKSSST